MVSNVMVLPNGDIIAAGDVDRTILDSEIVLHRYDSDGSLDTTFGNDGIAFADITPGLDVGSRIGRDPTTGRILVAGGVGAFGPSPDSIVVAFVSDPDEEQGQTIFMPIMLKG